MTITGPAAGVTISGNDQSSVLGIGSQFVPPVVVLSSLTITRGVSDFGGGSFNYQGTL